LHYFLVFSKFIGFSWLVDRLFSAWRVTTGDEQEALYMVFGVNTSHYR